MKDRHSSGTPEGRTDGLGRLKMVVGTWNVNGKSPPAHDHDQKLNLADWLLGTNPHHQDPPPDIFVLGFQEIVPLNAGNVLGASTDCNNSNGPAAMWLSLIGQFLNKNDQDARTPPEEFEGNNNNNQGSYSREYESSSTRGSRRSRHKYGLVASKQMVGIFLCVWIRSHLIRHVDRLKLSCVGTGIMGYLGNKGSVCISMRVHGMSFCFVCTHLASGEKEGDEVRRNSDVAEILRRTKFTRRVPGQPALSPQNILDHDKIIWLGDLNYRIISSSSDGQDQDNSYTCQVLQNKDWQAALQKDQLMAEQRGGRVFKGWEEGAIQFAPTYKYRPNSDEYAFHFHFPSPSASPTSNSSAAKARGKSRFPACVNRCDRILWKGEGLKQSAYNRSENRFSDHRPVYAHFYVQLASSKSCCCCCNANVARTTTFRKASSKSNTVSVSVVPRNKVQAEELLLIQPHGTGTCCTCVTEETHGPICIQS